MNEQAKVENLRFAAEKQREKVRQMKGEEEDLEFSPMHMQEEMPPAQYEQPEPVYAPTSNTKLTDKALS